MYLKDARHPPKYIFQERCGYDVREKGVMINTTCAGEKRRRELQLIKERKCTREGGENFWEEKTRVAHRR